MVDKETRRWIRTEEENREIDSNTVKSKDEDNAEVVRKGARKMKKESAKTVGKHEGGNTKAIGNEMMGVETKKGDTVVGIKSWREAV
jgi:hypothetical protein